MKYINITTPDNIDVEYRLAGIGSRLGAASIDTLVQFIIFLVLNIISFIFLFSTKGMTLDFSDKNFVFFLTFLIISYFIVFFGYFFISEVIMNGQTLGKKILGLRTIRQNGMPIGIPQSLIRNLTRVLIDNYGIGIIFMIVNKEHKRLGDLIAGTIVISENPDIISSQSLLPMESQSINGNLNNNYPLNPQEYEILKDYFARKDNLIDGGLSSKRSLIDYFSHKFNLRPEEIDDDLLLKIMEENTGAY